MSPSSADFEDRSGISVMLPDTETMREDYHRSGMISRAMPLADTGVLPALQTDASLFTAEINRLEGLGQRRVPYRLTPAIEAVSRDHHIVAVMQAVLGERAPLVMWGPNIQRQVPNAAGRWHVDIESWHWPTVTVVVGLAGCTAGNATRCIAGSHILSRQPPTTVSDAVALRNARAIDGRCDAICQFEGFGDGFFYVFNARAWHRGDHVAAGERLVLFLHYQLAQDPRVPYMKDYRHGTWFDTPAAHMMVNGSDSCSGVPNDSLYPRPRRKLRGYLALVGWRI